MSTTLEQIDARAQLNGWLQALTHMYQADIQAIPEDKWTATFGGCSKPCSSLTADAVGFLFWMTKAIKESGTPTIDADAMGKLEADCATKDGATAMLQKGSTALSEALMAASEETLTTIATAPWQMDAPIFSLAQIAVSHIWYHDGQLNYIQSMLGDGEYHWTNH